MRARACHRGFTLVELIAVMIVTAIMGAIAAGSLGALGASREADAGRTLLRDVSFARERAMATGLRHWVSFDVAQHGYSVLAEPAGGSGFASALALLDPATGSALAVRLDREQHRGVTMALASFDGASVVGFDWLGRAIGVAGTRLSQEAQVQLSGGVVVTIDVTSGAPSLALP